MENIKRLYADILKRYCKLKYNYEATDDEIEATLDRTSLNKTLVLAHKSLSKVFADTQSLAVCNDFTKDTRIIKSAIGNLIVVGKNDRKLEYILFNDEGMTRLQEIEALFKLYSLERAILFNLKSNNIQYGRYITLNALQSRISMPLDIVSRFCNDIYKELVKVNSDSIETKNSLEELLSLYSYITPNPTTSVTLSENVVIKISGLLKNSPINNSLKENREKELELLYHMLSPEYPRVLFSFHK